MQLRRLVGLASVCASCAALAGCGGGGQSSAGAAGAPGDPDARALAAATETAPVSTARAIAFGRAVNLTAADVPGTAAWSHPRLHETDSPRCWPGFRDRLIGATESPWLKRGRGLEAETFFSSADVYESAAPVRRMMEAATSAGARACLQRFIDRRIGEIAPDVRFTGAKVLPLSVDAPGASATVGVRLVLSLLVPSNGVVVPAYGDVFGFALGRAEVALAAISFTQPVPPGTERKLTALLAERADANAGAL